MKGGNIVRRNIRKAVFSHVKPTPLTSPRLVSVSEEALEEVLDLRREVAESSDFVDFVGGNLILETSTPVAHRYGGHQFGVWASQLGDGRAICLGEYINRRGERWEVQIKGGGLTPYSRDADGRAVLRSSIREFLCSEAMHFLGIPTSRAGALVVSSEDTVIRDPLYDGHPRLEPCAVVLRLAPTWFRIGSLELLAYQQENRELQLLLDYIQKKSFFPQVPPEEGISGIIKKIIQLNEDLVVEWQAIGFTHGVLNTDNISLLGITIDYGPFGFMEAYDPGFTPNHSDYNSRYSYQNQPEIMVYNFLMLLRSVSNLYEESELLELAGCVRNARQRMKSKLIEKFSTKLYLNSPQPELINVLLRMLEETKADFSMVFRQLSETELSKMNQLDSEKQWALKDLSSHRDFNQFIKQYKEILTKQGSTDAERMGSMMKLNPCYILRNWIAEEAIKEAEKGDYSLVNEILKILKSPFTRQPDAERRGYGNRPPEWSKTLCLSCSS